MATVRPYSSLSVREDDPSSQSAAEMSAGEDDILWAPEDFCVARKSLSKIGRDYQEIQTSLGGGNNSIAKYLEYRTLGHSKRIRKDPMYGLTKMIRGRLHEEKNFNMEPLDKIFCSQWINKRQVAFGTKCNNLVVLDTKEGCMCDIETLLSTVHTNPPGNDLCGIHAIAVNPSRTLLATGARNPNDTAVYTLPRMVAACVGEAAHTDWIFDIKWLDDYHYVSGGRDSKIILWQVDPSNRCDSGETSLVDGVRESELSYFHMCSRHTLECSKSDKVRALSWDRRRHCLLSLTLSSKLHQWDMQTMQFKKEQHLKYDQENVCVAQHDDFNLSVIGSKSFLTFFDSESLRFVRDAPAPNHNCGIRSVSFKDYLLTVGTGVGVVAFMDVRNYKYLDRCPSSKDSLTGLVTGECPRTYADLHCSAGWIQPLMDMNYFTDGAYNPAIYTHAYDPTGLKLFAAGGPLPASLRGAYAALWQ